MRDAEWWNTPTDADFGFVWTGNVIPVETSDLYQARNHRQDQSWDSEIHFLVRRD